jgi:hypothetical protein
MPWYGVNVVMAVRFKDGNQNAFPAWENVYLVEAGTPALAEKKGQKLGQEITGDAGGTLQWNGRPARWEFAGVRKSVEISGKAPLKEEPGDGTEVSYSKLEFGGEQALRDYARGMSATPKSID